MICDFCGNEIVTKIKICSKFVVVTDDDRGVPYATIQLCEECVENLQDILNSVKINKGDKINEV